MIFRIEQYRRPSLATLEGCELRRSLLPCLACYKGDASQAQTSNQTGAQTQGVAVSGTTNTNDSTVSTNTGTQLNLTTGGPYGDGKTNTSATNSGVSSQGSSGALYTAAAANSSVTVLNGVPVSGADLSNGLTAIFDGIKNILKGQPGTTVVVQPASSALATDGSSATNGSTGSATVTAPTTSTETVTAASTLTKWQMVAAVLAVFGTLYLIFKKKSA